LYKYKSEKLPSIFVLISIYLQPLKLFGRLVISMSDSTREAAATAAAIAAAVAAFNTELWTLWTFGVLITCLRTFARLKAVGIREFRADDFIIWFAIVGITFEPSLIGSNY
jgi:hypothetical protein